MITKFILVSTAVLICMTHTAATTMPQAANLGTNTVATLSLMTIVTTVVSLTTKSPLCQILSFHFMTKRLSP